MRRVFTTFFAFIFVTGIFAQTQDSLLRRQLELERDFNPTLSDANKITSLPTLREPVVQKASTNHSTWAGRTTPPIEIALSQPGDIMTSIPYSLDRGYISFYAGSFANLDGALGFNILNKEQHGLTFAYIHNSTNGDIRYVQNSNPADNKAFLMDNLGSLNYYHKANDFNLKMKLSYLNMMYNYYGNSFDNARFFDNENQQLGIINAHLTFESKSSDALNFNGSIDFKNFSSKYAETLSSDGISGNQIKAIAGFAQPFNDGENKVGIDGHITTTLYQGGINNYFLFNAAPYILLGGDKWHTCLGADVLFQNANNSQVRIVPNVDALWRITQYSSISARIHGGYNPNTYLDMIDESRFIIPLANTRPSFSHIDITTGVKIGELSGFRFDLFGGFRKVDDSHFLILNGDIPLNEDIANAVFIEALKPVYAHLSHSFLEGMLHTNIWTPLDFSIRLKKNFYDVSNLTINNMTIEQPIAYNKAGIEVDARATLNIIENLKITANYYYAGDRWSYLNDLNIKMDDINDLNLGAIYIINDALSLNLKVNNLLSQKYDIWYGHPAQGINASGGFSFTF